MITSSISKNGDLSPEWLINLDDLKWTYLNPELFQTIIIDENISLNSGFQDGVYPGSRMIPHRPGIQTVKVQRFPNYIEFSKVMDDEVKKIDDQSYLTCKFFTRRKLGWESMSLEKKNGKVIGYCFNGYVYNGDDIGIVRQICYRLIYRIIVENMQEYQELVLGVKNGLQLKLTGSNEMMITAISEAIQESIRKGQ